MAFSRKKREQRAMMQGDTERQHDEGHDEVEPKTGAQGDGFAALEEQVANLERELEEAKGLRLRALADFQNFQRRSIQNEEEAKKQGAAGVLRTVINALDHFDQALSQPAEKITAEQAVAGLKLIRDELVRAVQQAHGVTIIRPEANDEFTPGRHEALAQMPREGVKPGRVVEVYQPGYALGDRVLRAAKVIVSPGADSDAGGSEE
ncbi:MAG: nucleotide exchange factor GrpE [Phycisphaeraceae bacterium]|nr:nucleotide exchange factor GrpE [Phycisphaeraceae bacterium]